MRLAGTALGLTLSCTLGLLACQRATGHESKGEAPLSSRDTAQPSPSAVTPQPAANEPSPKAEHLDLERTCTKICQRSLDLKCEHGADCIPSCLSMASVADCSASFLAFYRCLEQEPLEHWRCDQDGIAAIREGFCDREQESAVGCIEHAVKP